MPWWTKFVQMVEDGVLRYVPWNELTEQEAELLGQRRVRDWRANSNGVLHERTSEQGERANVGTDLQLRFGLQERSLAMKVGGSCSFDGDRETGKNKRKHPGKDDTAKERERKKRKEEPKKGPRMPKGLIGMCSATPDGVLICYGWNLGTCQDAKAGDKGSKGIHLCCLPKCFQKHALPDCPDRKQR